MHIHKLVRQIWGFFDMIETVWKSWIFLDFLGFLELGATFQGVDSRTETGKFKTFHNRLTKPSKKETEGRQSQENNNQQDEFIFSSSSLSSGLEQVIVLALLLVFFND